MRAFLFSDQASFYRAVKQFVLQGHRLRGTTRTAFRRLEELGVDVHALAAQHLQDCLASQLPPRAFLRLAGALMCEGWKVAARFLMCLLGHAAPRLAGCASAADALERLGDNFCRPLVGGAQLDAFVTCAFAQHVVSRRFPFGAKGADACPTPSLDCGLRHALQWPRDCGSRIVDKGVLISLWSGPIPELHRHKKLGLVFSCERDGYSLRTLAQRCENATEAAGEELPMIFFLSTDCGVFGGYAPQLWHKTGGHWAPPSPGSSDSFVFVEEHGLADQTVDGTTTATRTHAPLSCYRWTGANELLMSVSNDHLLFGEGPAIGISDDFDGSSTASGTFGSPSLCAERGGEPDEAATQPTTKHFCVHSMEVFFLVSE